MLWQSLIATVNEQAKALQRAAFSPIVREAGDLANAVFDRRGRMVAQAVTGTPGHINSLARGASAMLEEYPPDSLVEGDVLITNDPYHTAGQLLDVTVLYPVFRNGRVIAFFGSTIHHTDVGGYGIGAGARDVFEEGLWIPIVKLMIAGERNADVWKFILSNVRQPDHMAGDLHAQMASGEVGAQRLLTLCERHGLDDIEELADEIIERSEAATRASIRELPSGTYEASAVLDLADGSTIDIVCAITVDAEAGDILVDYAGSSAASPYGINVVKNYTHAYTTFTVRSVLNPELPNNHGSLAPIRVEAPAGSIVHAVSPQPCTARHVVGMFLPNALLKALAQIRPQQAMAEGSGAVWTMQVSGNHDDGSPFITAMFTYAGGVGARATKPGLSACSYPTGVAAVPVEVVEASAPIRFLRKELRQGSGGDGQQTGGLGQTIEFTVDTTRPWQLNAVTSRLRDAPQGIFGGDGRRVGIVHRQRRAGQDAGPHDAATRRSRAPRAARWRRIRRAGGRRGWGLTWATFTEAWCRSVRAGSDTPFLVFERPDGESHTWTYSEFDALAARAGGLLQSCGVGAGSAVHLALTNSPAFVALWLAAANLGAWIVPSRPDELDAGAGRAHRTHPARRRVLRGGRGRTVYRPAAGDDAGGRARRGRLRAGAVRLGRHRDVAGAGAARPCRRDVHERHDGSARRVSRSPRPTTPSPGRRWRGPPTWRRGTASSSCCRCSTPTRSTTASRRRSGPARRWR